MAQAIAASLGLPARAPGDGFVLRARLLGGGEPVFLRSELDALGQPTIATLERSQSAASASHTKVLRAIPDAVPGAPPAAVRGTGAAA